MKPEYSYKKIPNFNYLDEIFSCIYNNKPFPCKQILQCGGRFSGKTMSNFTLFGELFAVKKRIRVRIYVFRKRGNTIHNTVFEEMRNALKRIGIKNYLEHISQNYFSNGSSKISFHSFNDNIEGATLTGLATAHNYTHAIKFFEERYEMSDDDINSANEAVRGAKYNLTICAANPWKLSHDWVQWLHQNLPFNLRELKNKGYQMRIIKDKLFHYMNYQVNPYLTAEFVERLKELEIDNPRRALTVCHGYPGELAGSIYAYALEYVEMITRHELRFNQQPYMILAGGLDFGFRQDAMACVVSGILPNFEKIDVIKEYFFNPKTTQKDLNTIAQEIINMLVNLLHEYPYITDIANYPSTPHIARGITVYCDYTEISFIQILRNIVEKTPYRNLIFFESCSKIEIVKRVTLQLHLMESKIVRVDASCINFYRELELAQWDSKKTTKLVVLDKDNHTQDAFHYGVIIPFYGDLQEKVNYALWNKDIKL